MTTTSRRVALGGLVERLSGARLATGEQVDLSIGGDGVVRSVTPTDGAPRSSVSAAESQQHLDLAGYLLLPPFADPHAHLDKVGTWDAIGPPVGDLDAAISAWIAYTRRMPGADVIRRARNHVRTALAAGTTAIRTHVDLLDDDDPLRSLRALVTLRAEVAHLIDLQVVPLAYPGTSGSLILEAVSAGADAVGGCPHLADDPAAETRRLIELAVRADVVADLHVDERLDGSDTLGVYADAVLAHSGGSAAEPGRFTASHCVLQSTLEPKDLAHIAGRVARAGIGVVALPITNLYLQGRDCCPSPPRAITPVRAWLDAGVCVAAGGDNVRDPFNPMGRGDPLETGSLLVTAAHVDIEQAATLVSSAARRVLGLPDAGPEVGMTADLVGVRAESLAAAMADGGHDRVVVRRGRLVARSIRTTEVL